MWCYQKVMPFSYWQTMAVCFVWPWRSVGGGGNTAANTLNTDNTRIETKMGRLGGTINHRRETVLITAFCVIVPTMEPYCNIRRCWCNVSSSSFFHHICFFYSTSVHTDTLLCYCSKKTRSNIAVGEQHATKETRETHCCVYEWCVLLCHYFRLQIWCSIRPLTGCSNHFPSLTWTSTIVSFPAPATRHFSSILLANLRFEIDENCRFSGHRMRPSGADFRLSIRWLLLPVTLWWSVSTPVDCTFSRLGKPGYNAFYHWSKFFIFFTTANAF